MHQSVNKAIMNGGRYVEWIDTAKVLTMLLVLIGHSNYYNIQTGFGGISAFDPSLSYGMVSKLIAIMTNFIYSFHMPFFMCLSGMSLRLSLRSDVGYSSFVQKKTRRLLYPFIFVTLFLSVPCKYLSGYYDGSSNPIMDIIVGQFLLFGNSHLWFVVSLFLISVIYFFLYTKRLNRGWIFYAILVVLSAAGIYLQSKHTEFLGIPGAMKNMLFFSLGFEFIQKKYDLNIKWSLQLLSWILMFATFIASFVIARDFILIKIFLAVWGCFNMIILSQLATEKISRQRWYSNLKRNSYSLYLYSDPFNYLLITLIVLLLGDRAITDNLSSAIAFSIRFVGSILLAYFVIYILNHILTPLFSMKKSHR